VAFFEIHALRIDLFLHPARSRQTPAGKALFGMMGVFAEFERSMIAERAGLAWATSEGGSSDPQ